MLQRLSREFVESQRDRLAKEKPYNKDSFNSSTTTSNNTNNANHNNNNNNINNQGTVLNNSNSNSNNITLKESASSLDKELSIEKSISFDRSISTERPELIAREQKSFSSFLILEIHQFVDEEEAPVHNREPKERKQVSHSLRVSASQENLFKMAAKSNSSSKISEINLLIDALIAQTVKKFI